MIVILKTIRFIAITLSFIIITQMIAHSDPIEQLIEEVVAVGAVRQSPSEQEIIVELSNDADIPEIPVIIED